MCWIPMAVWVLIYFAIGWAVAKDEHRPIRRLIYAVIWGILPVMANQSRRLAKHLKPKKTRLDETEFEAGLRMWKEQNNSW
jgi:hypothetical protein